ncbi:IS3 family transposase [Streptococcus salivarius]|uniref:IS3 family transposase n=1 Tax=Streptococcus salivarius TaxID=1304 RepID=UPI0034639B2D
MESFHATIKKECIYTETNVGYKDFQTCYDSIFKYIEVFYNLVEGIQQPKGASLQFSSQNVSKILTEFQEK